MNDSGGVLMIEVARVWTLLLGSMAIKGGVLLVIAGLLTLALRGSSAATRHLVWSLAMVGVLLLPLLAFVVPTTPVHPPHEIPLPVGALRFVPPESMQPQFQPEVTGDTANAGHLEKGNRPANPSDRPGVRGAAPTEAPGKSASATPRSSEPPRWLFGLWVVGVLVIVVRQLVALQRLQKLESRASELDPQGQALLSRACRDLKLNGRFRVLLTGESHSPQAWGLLRPTIILPRQWAEWSEDRRYQVLIHELAHVRRGDCRTQALAHLACVLYWFHPLLWYAAHRMRIERERACDDQVLQAGSSASSYADHLIEIASTIGRFGRPALGEVLMAHRSQISGRLLAILDPDRRRGVPRRGWVLFTGIVLLVMASALASLTAAGLDPAADYMSERDGHARKIMTLDDFKEAWGEMSERMMDAYHSDDPRAFAREYAHDAKVYSYTFPTAEGRREIADINENWESGVADIETVNMEFYRVGDLFCVIGKLRGLDRAGEVMGSSRFMSLYKYEDGRWRIYREIVTN